MSVTLIGLVVIGAWTVSMSRGVAGATFLTLLMIPLGAAAVVNLPSSGLSLLALQVTAALTTGVALLLLVLEGRRAKLHIPAAAVMLFLLCVYSVLSAYVMPRLFAHDILVVIDELGKDGVRVSEDFYTTLSPLEPRSANISQPAYLLASFGFFIVMAGVARSKGPRFIVNALLAAAALNAVLGVLDAMRLDGLLSFVRTADYAIVYEWGMHGADRLIGGFPEPSSFGSFSASFAALSASLFIDRRDWRSGLAAAASGTFAFMALSSTAIFGLAVLLVWLLARTIRDFLGGSNDRRVFFTGIFVSILVAAAAAALLILTPLSDFIAAIFESLILNKAESASGLERGFWAQRGIQAFLDTYGFGAGLGSLRANGLVSVVLGNVGLPGAILFLAFLWLVFFKPLPRLKRATRRSAQAYMLFRAVFAGAIVTLAMQTAAATILDPGILFFAFASVAVVSREIMKQDAALVQKRAARHRLRAATPLALELSAQAGQT